MKHVDGRITVSPVDPRET